MKSMLRFGSLLPAFLLAACGGGGGSSGPGGAMLVVKMHDTPVAAAEHVFVTVERVEVFRTDPVEGEVKETLVDVAQQHDLLALQHGVQAVLGSATFPPGDYRSIRLIVAEDSKHDRQTLPAASLKNYIVIDGEAHPLVVPSGEQTGIKFNHRFTLSPDAITTLTFDFDVRRSVHRRGKKDVYSLRPRLRLCDEVVSGSISGMVVTGDGSAIPAGTVVSAQQDGAEVASAAADPLTGAYKITPLLAGTYDLVLTAPGFGPAGETDVKVVAKQDSKGHDFVLESSDTGTISGTVSPATESIFLTLVAFGAEVATAEGDPVTGEYVFENVPVGVYTVVATNDGMNFLEAPDVEIFAAGDAVVVDFSY